MEKEVLISIKSTQSIGGEAAEPTELITQGSYACKGTLKKFSYMESAITGLEGTKTEFLIRPDEVVMNRTGTVTSRMVFRKGKKHSFLYGTPYGTLAMGVNTSFIDVFLNEQGGSLDMAYDLDFENALLSRNQISISIKEKSEKENS